MDNFSNAEKLNIEVEIDSMIGMLSGDVKEEEVVIPLLTSALFELRSACLKMDKKSWFNQLHDIFLEYLVKPSQTPPVKKIKLRFISLWNTLSDGEKFRIPNPVGKRIVYPMLDALDGRGLDARIKKAIDLGEIDKCDEMRSILNPDGQRLNYFASTGTNEPIFQLNYNAKEGIVDFFTTNDEYESLHKLIIMTIHDAVIKV